jgi:hypothetical protein
MPGVRPTEPKLGWDAGAADVRPISVSFPFGAVAGLSQVSGTSDGMTQVSGTVYFTNLKCELMRIGLQDGVSVAGIAVSVT